MSQNEMMKVRREILTAVNKNKEREKKDAIYAEMLTNAMTSAAAIEHAKKTTDHMENILDIRYFGKFLTKQGSFNKKICLLKMVQVLIFSYLRFQMIKACQPWL